MSPTAASVATWIKRAVIALALIIAVIAIPLISTVSSDSGDEESILSHRVARGTLVVNVTENGTVESSNNAEIKCQVKGGSTVLWVIEPGTMVEPGDELVRLDQSLIEDNILAQQIVYENALANKITAESDVAVAETSITEYLEGTFIEERSTIEKDIFDAGQTLKQEELALQSDMRLAARGLISELQLDGQRFAVESARKALELKKTQLEALKKYKKEKELQTLRSNLQAAEARLASFEASLKLEKARLDREREQLENCKIQADIEGMVIFPSMADWKSTPDIEEGAVVREQQTLLMIPDVTKMQVKVGIHESKVDRLRVGMKATIELQDRVLSGQVSEIAEVTKPAGWWTGNLVKYDTIIEIEQTDGLKPGMTALVDIEIANYSDVLTVPVAAILEIDDQFCCWIKTDQGVSQRVIEIGDTNDEYTVVTAGLTESDEVVLNPLAFIDEAQRQALKPLGPTRATENEMATGKTDKDSKRSIKSTLPTGPKKDGPKKKASKV